MLAAAEEINPTLSQLPGFQGSSGFWAVDRATRAMLAVSTWDSREHAGFSREALVSGGADAAAERRILDAGLQMDAPEIYEIAARA